MISSVNPYENIIVARLFDYFSTRTHWNRTLWNAGTILALREVLEASEAQNQGHLSEKSIKGAITTALRLIKDDPGMGTERERIALMAALRFNGEPREELVFKGMEYEQIDEVIGTAAPIYIKRWSDALASGNPPPAERTSRALAAHFLDLGFNSNFLHRWWTSKAKGGNAEEPIATIVAEAAILANKPEHEFSVMVPFPSELKPPRDLLPPASWLDATNVSKWLHENRLSIPEEIRQQGGLLLTIHALDAESAVQFAAERVELFTARVLLSLRKQIKNCGVAWVSGQIQMYSIERHLRGIKIGAMHRENRIWLESESDPYIDPAIELLAPLQSGTTTTAIAGGWAAIESLLGEPKNKKADPAERLATIVACSFPRAELTDLAYALAKEDTALAEQVRSARENKERAAIVAQAIFEQRCPEPQGWSDRAAIARMREVLNNPQPTLSTIKNHMQDTFARLYRQRNLILHAGRTRAVALRSTLRGAAPLVGAGLDRISHARFVAGLVPIRLAGRARTALDTVPPDNPTIVTSLLGN